MKEKNVSFDLALLAKECGFDEYCRDYYNSKGVIDDFIYYAGDGNGYDRNSTCVENDTYDNGVCVIAPTQAFLAMWLREKHNIEIQISLFKAGYKDYKVEIYKQSENSEEYTYFFIKEDDGIYIKMFNSYEKALELGLFQALSLIKS